MVSEAPSSHCHRRKWCGQKQLAPVHLDMPISKSTDPNADVTYTLWRFDVQGWLDQYQEESMMPHIYNSLRGYPNWWVCSVDGSPNLMVTELLEQMDCACGDSLPVWDEAEGGRIHGGVHAMNQRGCCSDLPHIPGPSLPTRARIWYGIGSTMA